MNKKPILPKILYVKDDGGPESGVKAYCLIEWKRFFSICLLRFSDETREAFHSHAFNAFSWLLSGQLTEERLREEDVIAEQKYNISIFPKYTSRNNTHRVRSKGISWVLTIRGPWHDKWFEYRNHLSEKHTLTHNRNTVSVEII